MPDTTSIKMLMLFAIAIVPGIASVPLGEQRAIAQEAPVEIDPRACVVDAEAVTASPPVGTPVALDDPVWDYSAGVPADTVMVQMLVDERLATFIGCINAGDIAAVSTLVTADYRRRYPFPIEDADPATPLSDDEMLTFTSVDAVRVHDTGEVTVFLVLQDTAYCESDVIVAFVFREVDGDWLIDDTAQSVGFEFAPWQPPGIRQADAPDCGGAASVAGIRSLQGPRGEGGETTTRTARDVIAALQSSDPRGEITLQNEQIDGFLDLRNVPSNKIRASNVRFIGGIDVSLPLEVSGLEAVTRLGMDFYFKDVVFEGPVNFRFVQFDKLECVNCTFAGTLDLTSVNAKHMYFRGSRFEAPVLFGYVEASEVLEVSSSHFEGHAEFTGVQSSTIKFTHLTTAQPIQIRWEEFGERWLDLRMEEAASAPEGARKPLYDQLDLDLRFWQQNFSALGQGRDARQVYRERVELRRDHFLDWTDAEKWEAFYMGAGTAYGTEPYRAVGIVMFVVLAFAVLYRVVDPFVPADPARPDQAIHRWSKSVFAFLFSVDAFVPFAVATGIKDAGWAVRGGWKWAVILERTLGSIATVALAYNVGAYLL